ncbi:MAG: photosynthetic reaction center cytochrome c subunit family protein [Gemmatimonadaceae bacterium]
MRSTLRLTSLSLMMIGAASCSQQKPASSPAPASGTGAAAAPATARPAGAPGGMVAAAGRGEEGGGRGGPPGGGRGGGRGGRGGPPMTPEQRAARRDSIGTLRTATTAQLMKSIAGKENEPAGTVFKNVQLLKDMPAGQFLTFMDQTVGRGLGRNCTDCHVANQWDSDSLGRKKTARLMIGVMQGINNDLLTKLPARNGNTPKINCITCHRGNPGGPGQALMP